MLNYSFKMYNHWQPLHSLWWLSEQLRLARGRPLPHLARVLLFESRRLLEEEFEGVAELKSSSRPAILAWVDDLPATR